MIVCICNRITEADVRRAGELGLLCMSIVGGALRDAHVGAARAAMHTVLPDLCTGCELCLPPCPVDCIDLLPVRAAKPPATTTGTYAGAGWLSPMPVSWTIRTRSRPAKCRRP